MSLKIKNVTFKVPSVARPIVDKIDLQIKAGEFVVLLGANGSGKSSLLKCINGLHCPQIGEIVLNGHSLILGASEKIAPFVSTLTQEVLLSTFGELTVKENCLCSQRFKPFRKDSQALALYLKPFHAELPHSLQKLASELSGGQRQCLALAMRLLNPPPLLLLDEHTSALDPKVEEQIMALTYERFIKQPAMMAIMATHNLDHALKYGSRLIVMRRGRIVFEVCGEEKKALTKEQLAKFY